MPEPKFEIDEWVTVDNLKTKIEDSHWSPVFGTQMYKCKNKHGDWTFFAERSLTKLEYFEKGLFEL